MINLGFYGTTEILDMKVVLLGYMASGKSSVGKALAEELNFKFIDLDNEISGRVGMDIPTLFLKKGEIFFRKKETEVLADVLSNDYNAVISLGGGTPCYGQNMNMINGLTTNSFYLNLSIPHLVDRISKEKQQRPLVANIPDEELSEFVGKHLFERVPFYTMAHHTILVNDKTVDAIISEIKERLV